jgi:hypothetical protein
MNKITRLLSFTAADHSLSIAGEMYRLTVYPADIPSDDLSGQLSLTFLQNHNESLGTYSISK